MLPGRAVQSRPAAPAHALVIGRVELDEVEGKALLVEAAQLRRIVVGEPPQLEGLGAAGGGAEGRQRLVARCRPLAPHGLLQGGVGEEEVQVLERRALVADLMGREAGAGHRTPPLPGAATDRKGLVKGKSVSVRVDRGGRRNMKKKTHK